MSHCIICQNTKSLLRFCYSSCTPMHFCFHYQAITFILKLHRLLKFLHSKHEIGSITSCCLGNETTLLPRRKDSWTHEFAIVNYHQSDRCLLKSSRQQKFIFLAPVVQTVNSPIHWINRYPADTCKGIQLHYPVDRDFSGGQHYPPFEQQGHGADFKWWMQRHCLMWHVIVFQNVLSLKP